MGRIVPRDAKLNVKESRGYLGKRGAEHGRVVSYYSWCMDKWCLS